MQFDGGSDQWHSVEKKCFWPFFAEPQLYPANRVEDQQQGGHHEHCLDQNLVAHQNKYMMNSKTEGQLHNQFDDCAICPVPSMSCWGRNVPYW